MRQRTVSSNSDISPSSSMATLTTYEDEQSREKLGAGGSRIRNDSMSTITGVRFDAHLNNWMLLCKSEMSFDDLTLMESDYARFPHTLWHIASTGKTQNIRRNIDIDALLFWYSFSNIFVKLNEIYIGLKFVNKAISFSKYHLPNKFVSNDIQ